MYMTELEWVLFFFRRDEEFEDLNHSIQAAEMETYVPTQLIEQICEDLLMLPVEDFL